FSQELTKILDFVSQLNALKTEGVNPLNNVAGKKNVFREDEVKPGLSQTEALANARSTHKGYFKVKAIFKR
ncbi:MAG: Asp-tRNA(Asn)/Glu-tRNA(Gln) amidotransferase subunit GatC, partial [Microgenomates group bacterium]